MLNLKKTLFLSPLLLLVTGCGENSIASELPVTVAEVESAQALKPVRENISPTLVADSVEQVDMLNKTILKIFPQE